MPVPVVVVGNATVEWLASVAFVHCKFMVLNVWFCCSTGNPHDIGISDACDVIAIKAVNMHKMAAAITILFTIYYPPLITEYFRRYVIY